MFRGINLQNTHQERELSMLLLKSADSFSRHEEISLLASFSAHCARFAPFGVVSKADREPFEQVLAEFGRCGLKEQLTLLSAADERLREREEFLRRYGVQHARLIRSLGLCAGAAMFLVSI